jgi:single-strand DNA-binding protein
MYNKVILVGNLTRDIELRYSQGGLAIAKTGLATNRKFTVNGEKKEEVMFIDITFFARSAEIANQYLRKGSKILVEGRLNFEQWVDQNGGKRSKHSITVESMQMLDSRNAGSHDDVTAGRGGYGAASSAGHDKQSAQQQAYVAPEAQQQPSTATQERPSMPGKMPEIPLDEDDIPFGYLGLTNKMIPFVI